MSLPPLTPEQRAAALRKGALVRKERADIRLRLRNGDVTLSAVIAEPADAVRKMKVSGLLTAMPGVGKVRAAQIMARIGIAENRTVSGLGPNQKAALELEFADA